MAPFLAFGLRMTHRKSNCLKTKNNTPSLRSRRKVRLNNMEASQISIEVQFIILLKQQRLPELKQFRTPLSCREEGRGGMQKSPTTYTGSTSLTRALLLQTLPTRPNYRLQTQNLSKVLSFICVAGKEKTDHQPVAGRSFLNTMKLQASFSTSALFTE